MASCQSVASPTGVGDAPALALSFILIAAIPLRKYVAEEKMRGPAALSGGARSGAFSPGRRPGPARPPGGGGPGPGRVGVIAGGLAEQGDGLGGATLPEQPAGAGQLRLPADAQPLQLLEQGVGRLGVVRQVRRPAALAPGGGGVAPGEVDLGEQ